MIRINKELSGHGLIEVKLKVKVTLQHITTRTEGEQRYSSTHSLTSAFDGVSSQCTVPAVLPRERAPVHSRRGWVGPRLVRTGMVMKKSISPHGGSKSLYRLRYAGRWPDLRTVPAFS